MPQDSSLLLVTHVAIRQGPKGPMIDDQTAAGIRQWCRHFDRVTYIGVHETNGASSATWVDADEASMDFRAKLLALPRAYGVGAMAKNFGSVRSILRSAVHEHRHLCFTVGGLIGDWPALAAVESMRQARAYAAWIDRVEPSIIRNKVMHASLPKKLAATIAIPVMEKYTQFILKNSKIALLQGMDTFNHYGRWAPDPHCTYDTHTHPSDRISVGALDAKMNRVKSGAPLNIVYVGRAAAMKGPMDWLDVLDGLRQRNVQFQATWIGDGPDLEAMKSRLARSELGKSVVLSGFEGDREVLLGALRASDLLLFCHKTPESPRCLVESLVSGCPIVGYGTDYPRGLVNERGGGGFVAQDDVLALVDLVARLNSERTSLAHLIDQAARSGELYNEGDLYAHRADLMKRA